MDISLTQEQDHFVITKIASGQYTSASEVVREALQLMEERDRERGVQLGAFREQLAGRLASLNRGEYVSAATAKEHIERRTRARQQRA